MVASVGAQSLERITPGQEWPDRKGEHINAHGGGLLFHEGKYYWYGEAVSWSVPRWYAILKQGNLSCCSIWN